MKHSPVLLVGAALLLSPLATPAQAAATILHNFTGGASDGAYPHGSLTLSGSTLYGMTNEGGSNNMGALFRMNTDGTGFGVLHSFTGGASDGALPEGTLTLSGSKFYGMTRRGGSNDVGTIFRMNTDGSNFELLHTFANGPSNGASPLGSLTLSGTKLYGATSLGGSNNLGTIFSMNTDGTGFSLLRSMSNAMGDSAQPQACTLTLSGSKLFGMGPGGNGAGAIFSLNTDGTGFGLIHTFAASDGAGPVGSLLLSGSELYGMTSVGGGDGDTGVIFSVNTDGTGFGLLHSFAGGSNDGKFPLGSLMLSDAKLYGMTFLGGGSGDLGTLFSIGTDGTGFGLLERFGGAPADGARPQYSDVTISADGSTLYGMTVIGGTANKGVVFSRAVPEPGACVLLGFGAFLLSARRRNARA